MNRTGLPSPDGGGGRIDGSSVGQPAAVDGEQVEADLAGHLGRHGLRSRSCATRSA